MDKNERILSKSYDAWKTNADECFPDDSEDEEGGVEPDYETILERRIESRYV